MSRGKTQQSWNPRIDAYVKFTTGTNKATGGSYVKKWDVKEREPSTPFRNIPIKKPK